MSELNNLYSRRNGIEPKITICPFEQFDRFNERTKNRFCLLFIQFFDKFKPVYNFIHGDPHLNQKQFVLETIWKRFYGSPEPHIIEKLELYDFLIKCSEDLLNKESYHKTLDLLEFIFSLFSEVNRLFQKSLALECIIQLFNETQQIVSDECLPFSFIEHKFVPLTNETEVKSIEETYKILSTVANAKIDFESALALFRNKEFNNAVNKGFHTIEKYCQNLCNDESKTLGSLCKDKDSFLVKNVNSVLLKNLSSLYGWSSEIVRHGTKIDKKTDKSILLSYSDAKFYLVTVSAYINLFSSYLHS